MHREMLRALLMRLPNTSVTQSLPKRLDTRQASIVAALLVWLAGMPAVFGLCVFFGAAPLPAAEICAGGALAALFSLCLRPIWARNGANLLACLSWFVLGAMGAAMDAQWASAAWALIFTGFALGLALRAPLGPLALLALLAGLGGLAVQAYGQPEGLARLAWLFVAIAGAALGAGLLVIGLESGRAPAKSTRQFLLGLVPEDRLAVLGALEAAWANGNGSAENLKAGPFGAGVLLARREDDALVVRWRGAKPMPMAVAVSAVRPGGFEEQDIAELAHEMRTPLHQILGFAEIIEAQMLGPLDHKYTEYAGLIGVSGRHLLDLTDSWLERARLQAGARTLELEEFDLQALASEALRGFSRLAALKQIRLHLEGEACPVRADRRAWRQILLNLLGNAIKFTPEGGEVCLRVGAVDGQAWLHVEDSGPGIAPQDRARILRPFERAANASRQDGVGLGLSIVLGLVRLHDGEVQISASDLGGAMFGVSAPIGLAGPVTGLQINQGGGEIPRLEQQL